MSRSLRLNDPDSVKQRDLVAVIDIGSNSVRLVISDLNDLRPGQYMLNEKVMCQLGRGLQESKSLDPSRREYALNTLRWFAEICAAADCRQVMILATAALRTASDAHSFVAQAETLFNCKIQVLSGEEEARTAATGVAASIYGAAGLVADLGGGSLDLAPISTDDDSPALTLPTGTLVLKQQTAGLKPKKRRKAIKKLIQNKTFNQGWMKSNTLYLVGGTWRALALEHIRQIEYPLNVVHRYELSAKKLAVFCKHIARMADEELDLLTEIVPRRREVIREAAAVLEALLESSNAKRAAFAGTGVREGFLHQQLQLTSSSQPEIDAARRLVVGGARFSDHGSERTIGDAIYDWSRELRTHFASKLPDRLSTIDDARRKAACQLTEFGWSRHPSYKASETASLILHSNRLTHDHTDRAYMALCLFRRYGGQKQRTITKGFKRLLPGRLKWEANVLGLIIRVAMSLSSGIPSKLSQTNLTVIPSKDPSDKRNVDRVCIHVPASWKDFPIIPFEREVQTLARKYDIDLELRYER